MKMYKLLAGTMTLVAVGLLIWLGHRLNEHSPAPASGAGWETQRPTIAVAEPGRAIPIYPASAGGLSSPPTAAGPTEPHLPRPAWVDRLLRDPATRVPYPELVAQPVGRDIVDALLKRFDELPALPFTNKFPLAQALAVVGDERVLRLFQRVLFEDYRGQRLEVNDGLHLSSLLVLTGHLAARYPQALALLRDGLNEEFWATNITWSMDDVYPPSQTLVNSSILGLAMTGRDDAWEWVLAMKREGDQEYLDRHASRMVDAATARRYLLDYGRAYLATNSSWKLFLRWADTPEGKEWRAWAARIHGLPPP